MSIDKLKRFLAEMQLSPQQQLIGRQILKEIRARVGFLADVGLEYLSLARATGTLSGGEAQRLKLASEMGKGQADSVFVFDEPTIGLHPLDVQTLLGVFQALVDQGATVLVIEHDLDVIRNADYVIDMGPGGGAAGGRVVAVGTPKQIAYRPTLREGRTNEIHVIVGIDRTYFLWSIGLSAHLCTEWQGEPDGLEGL